jgi:micrococcal nuclease
MIKLDYSKINMIPKRSIGVVIIVIVATLFFVIPQNQDCMGDARCIKGQVTQVVDGDTIKVEGQSIGFALASAPELYDAEGVKAKDYLEKICAVGSRVLVDEDDGQTMGSYSRVIALVRCNGLILNEAVLAENHAILSLEFCPVSEFSDSNWAKENGC